MYFLGTLIKNMVSTISSSQDQMDKNMIFFYTVYFRTLHVFSSRDRPTDFENRFCNTSYIVH